MRYPAPVTLLENVPLAAHTTLGLGGPARFWAELTTDDDIPAALDWAESRGLEAVPLGSGSNLLAADRGFDGLILHLALRGLDWQPSGRIRSAAGEDWDALVAASVARGCAGLECLSGIPGSVGATPVQNVGAYGQEVAETITTVRAWDRRDRAWVTLANSDCAFAYRSSRFNTADRGRFIISAVEFQLRPGGAPTLRYPELQRSAIPGASLAQVRSAVLALRRSKAMLLEPGEPDSRSAGSFFKNPVLTRAQAAAVTGAPQFPDPSGGVKIPAAWLIEHSGFAKGFSLPGSGIRLSRKHVLALVNDGSGTAEQALALARHIRQAVETRCGIRLETEPVTLACAL